MSDTVTLRLNGEVSLDQFARAIGGFKDLVRALSADETVTWRIADLDYGSASATVQGVGADPHEVSRVVRSYAAVANAANTQALTGYSKTIQTATGVILSVLDGGIDSIDFETADGDVTVRSRPQVVVSPAPFRAPMHGAVTGRVQTVSSRGSLRFTLYDQVHDRAVACYLAEGREEIMRGVWDKIAVVEGVVTRDEITGRPKSIRQVRNVIVRHEGLPMDYLSARGASPSVSGMTAVDAVRRVRDA